MSNNRLSLFADNGNYNPNRVGLESMVRERQELEDWVSRLDIAIEQAYLKGDDTRIIAVKKSRIYAMSQLKIAKRLVRE